VTAGADQWPLRYVALGDSLSEGVGDEPWPDGTARGWTDRLAGLLSVDHEARGVEYANLAVRGYKAAQVRDTQLDAALAMDPDVVTLTAGMNDILRLRVDFDELQSTLISLVQPFTVRGTRVVVVPIPDVSRISPFGSLINERRNQLNTIYQDLVRHHGVLPLTDTRDTVFEDARAWDQDRLHLSALGHECLSYAAAVSLGIPITSDFLAVPAGVPPARTVRSEAEWWWGHAAPWIGRRLRGKSSGDGRVAKRPVLAPM
jgi:lysophospholipase L1-like esterase